MRRLAIGFVAVLVALLGVLVLTTIITMRSADPLLWPPQPDARTIDVYVVGNGYHNGIALPRESLVEFASGRGYSALMAVGQRFNRFPFLEIGWGEENFYRKVPSVGDMTPSIALRALFATDNKSVLHVVGVPGDPVRVFSSGDVVRITLSSNGFDQLLKKVEATFVPPQNGVLPDIGKGLYGTSLFYPAVGMFNFTHVCNHWVAELLSAAGLPSTPVLDTFAFGFLLDLRWRAGLRPVQR